MGNSLRCCLACVLPCGALDLVRIVHINGHVEVYSRAVSAKEILEANPNHVISKPAACNISHATAAVSTPRIVIVSPGSELKRGTIYFLIPASSSSSAECPQRNTNKKKKDQKSSTSTIGRVTTFEDRHDDSEAATTTTTASTEEKTTGGNRGRRKSGRVGVEIWRPHLESIYED